MQDEMNKEWRSLLIQKIDELNSDIKAMRHEIDQKIERISEWKGGLDEKYVSQKEFAPVKQLIYGAVGTILLALLGSVIALVTHAPK